MEGELIQGQYGRVELCGGDASYKGSTECVGGYHVMVVVVEELLEVGNPQGP